MLASPGYNDTIETVFVIGGGQVYKEALESPLCDAVHLTAIESDLECDTFFPAIDGSKFRVWSSSPVRRRRKRSTPSCVTLALARWTPRFRSPRVQA